MFAVLSPFFVKCYDIGDLVYFVWQLTAELQNYISQNYQHY